MADGEKYRFRMVNAIPLDCPLSVNIARHEVTIIAADGKAVKPTTAGAFVLLPGYLTVKIDLFIKYFYFYY